MSTELRTQTRLALVWFLYMAGFGLYFPYWSLYLKENAGLAPGETGVVIASLSLMGMLSQPFWGQIADRTGSRTRVLAGIMLGAGAGFLALHAATGFGGLLLANAFFAGFHTAVMPMTVAVSLATLRDSSRHAFGIVRSAGTVGFITMAWLFPRALDAVQARLGWVAEPGGPSEPGLAWMFVVSAAMSLSAAAVALGLPRAGAVSLQASRGDWRALPRHRPYLRLAVFGFVAFFATHGPMLFFPQLVTATGGTLATVSNMWLPMVAFEIPMLMAAGLLADRVGVRGMIAIGLGAAALRWLLCGFATSIPILYATCLLHGITVGGLMMGSPLYVEAVVPEKLRSTGQGLMATCVHFGAMLSSMSTGWLVGAFSIETPYRVGGTLCVVLLVGMPWLLPAPRRPDDDCELVAPQLNRRATSSRSRGCSGG
ncbi:MAG TPA: MFS transporter [Myxococcota bacterium]|nr:MFS transporter [Myxococcota bacterium]